MTRRTLAWTITFPFVFAATAFAQHGHNATPKPPTTHGSSTHVSTTSHGSSTHVSTTTHGGSTHVSTTSHGHSSHATTSHANTSHAKTSHGSSHAAAKPAVKTTKTTTTKTTTKATTKATTTGTTTTGTTTTGTTPLTPVQQKLQRNTNLASKLQSRLPVGTDLMTAAKGFRNLGQFVAAVNVSNNQGISFTALKTRMVDGGMSLGQALQDVKPTVTTNDTTAIARRAEADADATIRSTEQTTTTTSKTKSKSKDHK